MHADLQADNSFAVPCLCRQDIYIKLSALEEALTLLSRKLDAAEGTAQGGVQTLPPLQPHALLVVCQAAGQAQYMLVSIM